jgi:hypothetical protein
MDSTPPFPTPIAPSQNEVNRRMREWYVAMELSHAMLMAGLRRKIGPDGDIHAAYREWYSDHQDRKWEEIAKVQEERARKQQAIKSNAEQSKTTEYETEMDFNEPKDR